MWIPKTYTVESVAKGHPDKVCDQISDAILDEYLKQDPMSRVAVECLGSGNLLVIGGEVTSKGLVDVEKVARDVYREIGYQDELEIIVNISQQSPEIAHGVDNGGAGDQGIMYVFATNETPEYLPIGVVLSYKLAEGVGQLPGFGPDGKTQVTIENGHVGKVVVSTQHSVEINLDSVRDIVREKLVERVIGVLFEVELLINPAGAFTVGGFKADAGQTGRKIMVDTYGGIIPHGGGCFSGKDATKVDRSGAYMARFVSKDIVSQGLAEQCLVSVAYAIGRAEPLMVQAVDEKGKDLTEIAKKYDFRPGAIIERLDLRRPVYQKKAVFGHFGRAKVR